MSADAPTRIPLTYAVLCAEDSVVFDMRETQTCPLCTSAHGVTLSAVLNREEEVAHE